MTGFERIPDVLLAEDNPADVRLTKEAFAMARVRSRIHVAPDGLDALAFLRRQGRHHNAMRPDLIVLDLELPKLSGIEVLRAVKNDSDLYTIPCVVLTSSLSERDIARAYEAQAACCVSKPIELNRFAEVVQAIGDFWLGMAQLAPRAAAG